MLTESWFTRIVLRLDDVPPVPLSADPVLLQRAVNNLVSNAIAHTPEGGVVSLGADTDGAWLTIRVANSGAGIPPVHIAHVFERYYRGDDARTTGSSAGLGLAIVRAIMRLHGGTADVESIPGQRTVFLLRFPVQPAV